MDQIGLILRRIVVSSWRHRWKALLVAWILCLAGWAVVQRIPDQYRASARVYADVDAVLGAVLRNLAVDGSPQREVDLLIRTLLTRPNLERIIARTDLDLRVASTADRERLIQELGRTIRIGTQRGRSSVFSIEYTDTDPRLARDVVQAVVTLFMESATATDRQQLEQARTFIEQQIRNYEAQLRAVEQRRIEFRNRYFDLLPLEQGGMSRLDSSRTRLATLRGELEDTRQRRNLLAAQLEEMQRAPARPRGGGGVDPRLAAAERTLRELQLRYTDEHPDVVNTRAIIAQLRSQGARGGGGGEAAGPGGQATSTAEQVRLRVVDLDGQIASLERQVEETATRVSRLEELLRTVPQVQNEFANLNRDYDVLQRNYQDLIARRESLQIAGAARREAERVRLEVIEPPVVPLKPVAPNRLLLLSGVLLGALGAGGALALLLGQLDSSFYSLRDLRQLGLPVLGAVSSADPPRLRGAIIAFSVPVGLLFLAYGAVVLGVDPRTFADRVPSLVNRLLT
ncbi:MAG: XrtA system polysaccharide chain length determinant [Acetobacteraceae bacterium]